MDAVAAAAGVSKRTLYGFHPSKEALFGAVVGAVTIEGSRRPLAAPRDPADAVGLRRSLTDLAAGVVETMLRPEYLALLRVVVAEAPRFPDLAAHFRAAVPDRGFAAVDELLERARGRGLVAAVDREAAGRLFLGTLVTYLLYDGLLGGGAAGPPPRDRLEAAVDLFVRAVSVGPSPG